MLATTGFARYSPRVARLILALIAAAIAFCLAVSLSSQASGFADAPRRGSSDVELYRAEIDRVHQGENYYAAANAELRTRGYPTGNIFNWRTPLPMWLFGALPSLIWGKALLCAIAMYGWFGAIGLLAAERNGRASCLVGLLLLGGLLPCVLGDLCVLPVVWAGVLLLASMVAASRGRVAASLLLGLAALFVRDLAAPYVVFRGVEAAARRRWREAAGWAAGLLAYGCFFAWHAAQAAPYMHAGDLVHKAGWVRCGGAAFVISTVQMNAFLLLLPQWVSALYLPLALAGFAGWQSPRGRVAGLTAALFVLLFAVVGQPFNQYWGSLLAPLLCLGAAQSPAVLGELWRAAQRRAEADAAQAPTALSPA
ncbi:MAG TPA: hypothetical protein VFE24_02020 [Pirellulales bacterium]|jgi:hypothetical protein|nr:hypothetical protein [Pirellulales bacterium]